MTRVVVSRLLAVCSAVAVLPAKRPSPGYVAVIVWLPAGICVVTRTALLSSVPELTSSALPRGVVPMLKLTVPVGLPPPDAAVAVAVRVTAPPITEGSGSSVSANVVATVATWWVVDPLDPA